MSDQFKIHLQISDQTACAYYRAVLPHRHCHKSLLEHHKIQLELNSTLDLSNNYDAFIFHRCPNPSFFPTLFRLKSNGAKIIWDLDDDLFGIPEWSSAYEKFPPITLESLSLALSLADIITVSTEPLGASIAKRGWGNKVRVLPNLIDPLDWGGDEVLDAYPRKREWPHKIFWGGSDTHSEDLKPIVPVVESLVDEYKSDIQFIFMGYIPEELCGMDPGRVLFLAGCPIRWYPSALRTIGATIGLAPLVEHGFNECKSNIKYLEYTMAGMVTVASDIGPYKNNVPNVLNVTEKDLKDHIMWMMDSVLVIENHYKESLSNVINKYSFSVRPGESHYSGPWFQFFRSLAG